MAVTVQLSVYPLRQQQLTPAIERAVEAFRRRGLQVEAGPMSTIVAGEDDDVFAALQEAYQAAAAQGHVVMVATFSNACPVPPPPTAASQQQ